MLLSIRRLTVPAYLYFLLCCTNVQAQTTVFVNATVLPMSSEVTLNNMDVIVVADRIVTVAPTGSTRLPDGAAVIDATGHFLIPGLSEMHGHIPPTQGGNAPARYVEDVLLLYLAGGITTVRGMLGYPNQLALKEQVKSGGLLGPNLYLAGPSFSGSTINSPDEAVGRVKQQVAEGWDLIKVHPGLTLDEYTAVATTARELGIPFAGHIPVEVGLENALNLGQQTIDHLDGYMAYANGMNAPVNEAKLKEAIEMSAEIKVWVVPTQAVWESLIGAANPSTLRSYDENRYMPKAVINSWDNYLDNITNSYLHSGPFARLHANNRDKLLRGLQEAGVGILMGSDAPQVYSVPGFSIHREIQAMSRAGLSNFEILQSGTANVGMYFRQKDLFGLVAENHRADLLLLKANPLDDLTNLKSMIGVMVRGTWIDRQVIDRRLQEIEAAYKE